MMCKLMCITDCRLIQFISYHLVVIGVEWKFISTCCNPKVRMIWKKVFPPQGGGAVRRWVRMRKEMFEFGMNQSLNQHSNDSNDTSTSTSGASSSSSSSSSSSQAPTTLPMKPLTMFDFRRADDAADARAVDIGSKLQGWRISDDEVLGGYSRANFTLMGAENQDQDPNQDQDLEHKTESVSEIHDPSSSSTTNTKTPFIRWQGNIDTRIPPKSRAKRSGFCAIRCPEFPFGGIPVGSKYNALEVQCRTDGRSYTLNLKVQTFFPDDLYQSMISVNEKEVEDMKALKRLKEGQKDSRGLNLMERHSDDGDDDDDGFISVVLPFQDFILTSHGRVKAQQRTLDGAIQLQHLGLTLMDGIDGPFQIDLAKIRLVNYSFRDGIIVNDDDDDDDDDGTDESFGDGADDNHSRK